MKSYSRRGLSSAIFIVLAAFCFGLPARVGATTTASFPAPANLHVVAIGINKYQVADEGQAPADLGYARQDAEAIAALFRERGPALYHEVKVHLLLDDAASKAGIEAAIRQVIVEAKPNDTFVLAFSGYNGEAGERPNTRGAKVVRAKGDNFYLMTADARSRTNADELRKSAIPGSVLRLWFDQIQAERQIFVLDTCQSADAFVKFSAKTAADAADPQRLARRSTLVLGAAGFCWEEPQLGHGVLTYALLQGLSGEADTGWPGDGLITARELTGYLSSKVSELKPQQNFRSYVGGADFPLLKAPETATAAPDKTPLAITISAPQMTRGFRLVVDEAALEVAGSASDDGLVRAVAINGQPAELKPNGDFRAVLNVPLGETEVIVRATDAAGNAATQTFTVKREVPGAPAQIAPDRQGADYALPFANDQYDHWPKLNNPIHDAQSVGVMLEKQYGFKKVEIVTGFTRRDIAAKLSEYRRLFAERGQPDDQFFVYFAGHGYYDAESKEGFLVAKDSPDTRDQEQLRDAYYSLSNLAADINSIPCRHIFAVIDACYGGTFSRRLVEGEIERDLESKGKQTRAPRRTLLAYAGADLSHLLAAAPEAAPAMMTRGQYIRRVLRPVSRVFLTSGQLREVSDGPPGGHSPFAARFIESLQEDRDEYNILDYETLKRAVLKLLQEPQYGRWGNSRDDGSFLFIGS